MKQKKTMLNVLPIIIILIFSIFLPISAQDSGDKTKDINTLYKEGIQAHKDKNFGVFLERFKALDQLLPNHPVILYNLAGACTLNKMEKSAIQYLERLIIVDANTKIAEDNDFLSLHRLPAFKRILEKIKQIHTPISNSSVAFRFPGGDMHPESIAYDPQTKRFYLSSVRYRKILYFDSQSQSNKLNEFTTSGQDGLDSVMGIRIDPVKRILWVTSTAMPQMIGYKKEDKGRTAVFKYNLDTRKLLKKYPLNDGPDHGFDDVVIHPDGDIYLSDTRNIYRIDSHTDTLSPLLASDSFRSLQGIIFCNNGKYIIAADWNKGLFLVNIEKKTIITEIKPPEKTSLRGIDGLYYLEQDNCLLAIQNGVKPFRVMRFFLDKSLTAVTRAQIIERATPHLDEPTLGVITPDHNFYYVANSPWGRYTKDQKPLPAEKQQDIIILKTPLIVDK